MTINDGKKLTVPSLIGLPVRKVIEAAAIAGLDVQIIGNGTAREQGPALRTQVPAGDQDHRALRPLKGRVTLSNLNPSTINHNMKWKDLAKEVATVESAGDSA